MLIQPLEQNTDDISDKPNHQFKNNKKSKLSRLRVVSELFLILIIITIPLSVQAGFFAKFFKSNDVINKLPLEASVISVMDIPLLTAQKNPNPSGARGGAEIIINENTLVSSGPVGADEIAEQKNNQGVIRVYIVREGDSLSQIAEMFGVTTNTIMWANDIVKANDIKPGDSLVILPIPGVRHVVKSGDTIASIAKKYKGEVEEILSYNQLISAEEISVGNTLIIPGGTVYVEPIKVATQAGPVRVSGATVGTNAIGFSHPAPGSIKTQGIHGYNAVDLAGSYGSSIRAAASGEVIVSKSSGWNGGYGQYIVIKHNNGTQTLYAHLSSNAVGVGAYVTQSEVIGGMGSTGRSTGNHLHFEVRGGANPF